MRKKTILFSLVIVFIICLIIVLFSKNNFINNNPDENTLEQKIGSVYLYYHEYTPDELLEEDQLNELFKEYDNYKLYLYVASVEIIDRKDIDVDNMTVNITDLENYGEHVKKIEDNQNLTEKYFKNKVETNKNKIYQYYVIKSDSKYKIFMPKKFEIEVNDQIIYKNIDMLMGI